MLNPSMHINPPFNSTSPVFPSGDNLNDISNSFFTFCEAPVFAVWVVLLVTSKLNVMGESVKCPFK